MIHIQPNDAINGSFELGAALFSIINIHKLWIDKKLAGVHWIPTMFFTIWGAWNLWYYPSLNQPLSFFGGISMFLTNITWISMALYYSKKK